VKLATFEKPGLGKKHVMKGEYARDSGEERDR